MGSHPPGLVAKPGLAGSDHPPQLSASWLTHLDEAAGAAPAPPAAPKATRSVRMVTSAPIRTLRRWRPIDGIFTLYPRDAYFDSTRGGSCRTPAASVLGATSNTAGTARSP